MASELQSFSSTSRAKRPSIGMANLTDRVAPLHHAPATAPALESKSASALLPPTASAAKNESGGDSDGLVHIREASPVSSPPSLAPTEITAADLFDAIASDTFFDVVSRHSVELAMSSAASESQELRGIDVNAFHDAVNGKTLLHQACKRGDLHVIKCLLYHGADVLQLCRQGRTALHDVVSSSQRAPHTLQILQTLHAHDPRGVLAVDVNGTHVVHLAAIHGCLDVLQWCASLQVIPMAITSFSGRNALHYAAYNARLDVLRWLVEHCRLGLHALDANGYSVLHYAAMGGHLDVCQWLVLDAPTRNELSITATNSDGHTAADLARDADVQAFLDDASSLAPCPSRLHCIGADGCSLGIAWLQEPASEDPLLADALAPLWYELEYCEKPSGLRRTSALMAVLMMSSTAASASSYLLAWKRLDVLIAPDASEFWLAGLESDREYLVRMRTVNRNGVSEFSVPTLSGEFTTTAACDRTASARVIRGLIASIGPRDAPETSFIGTMALEILEARRLQLPSSSSRHGRFYCALTLKVPVGSAVRGSPLKPRRTSMSNRRRSVQEEDALSPPTVRYMYRLRSSSAAVQEDLLLSGNLNALRHPRFSFASHLRVSEVADASLCVEICYETPDSAVVSCVGRADLPIMELVRGFPAKLRWLVLQGDGEHFGGVSSFGEVLVRSLFLPDGISSLPHPIKPGVFSSTAEELLDSEDQDDPAPETPTAPSPETGINSTAEESTADSPTVTAARDPSPTRFDGLGFRVLTDRRAPKLRSFDYYLAHQQCVAQQQDRLWLQFHRDVFGGCGAFETFAQLVASRDKSLERYREPSVKSLERLRRLAWEGVPPCGRRFLYLQLSGAESRRLAALPSYYNELKARVRPEGFETIERQIQVDLQRTFAGHRSWINTVDGQQAMGRVLQSFALHNPSIGYCQSMSFIVGRLLCLFCDPVSQAASDRSAEEDVFWLLVVLCEDVFPSYYTKGMEGLHVDGRVLETLLPKRLPKIVRHFQHVLQNPPQMGLLLVTGWLLPVFSAVFPSETSFRLLDVVICEGSSVVFALVVALLRMAQRGLLTETRDYMQIFRFLRDRDQRLHDTALLMEVAREEHELLLREFDIARLREDLRGEQEDGAGGGERRAVM
ncbi:hypothetical protein ATCC90586_007169 [Pythium insidiosum]|nr:hypothetical protein ATCC90586_007169 [Pythium insidiosum]